MAKVVDKFIIQLETQLSERNVEIQINDKARAQLAKEGYDPAMGARPLARLIQEKIKKPLAEELLLGALENGGIVTISWDAKKGYAIKSKPHAPKKASPSKKEKQKA